MIVLNRFCCGSINLKTGVLIITIFGILNKLSGFYGIISLDFSDTAAFVGYLYSLFAVFVLVQGLYGLKNDNARILRWYAMFFWLDCIVSSISTIWFAVKWYTSMDQQLDDTTDNEEAKKMLADSLKMEKMLSIGMLVLLRLVHFYFAYVVTLYYKSIHMAQYARVPSSMEQGEEETELDTRNPTYPSSGSNKVPKPSID